MDREVVEALEYFIDYTLTDDKNKLKTFIELIERINPYKIEADDYCSAHNTVVSPTSKYCFLGQTMSNQYKTFFKTCSGCPFFFSKDFLEALREYASGDKTALPKILHEAEERKNAYIVNYYRASK